MAFLTAGSAFGLVAAPAAVHDVPVAALFSRSGVKRMASPAAWRYSGVDGRGDRATDHGRDSGLAYDKARRRLCSSHSSVLVFRAAARPSPPDLMALARRPAAERASTMAAGWRSPISNRPPAPIDRRRVGDGRLASALPCLVTIHADRRPICGRQFLAAAAGTGAAVVLFHRYSDHPRPTVFGRLPQNRTGAANRASRTCRLLRGAHCRGPRRQGRKTLKASTDRRNGVLQSGTAA